jgi:hypothetical protein
MMKHKIIFPLLGLCALTACEPKNEPRWQQEGARTWTAQQTPVEEEVRDDAFYKFDLDRAYQELKTGGDLTTDILQPLSDIVLNRKFIEDPRYFTQRLQQMVSVFNSALAIEYKKSSKNQAFGKIKDAYYQTVFSGCTRDLRRDCRNAGLFSKDGRHTLIMTLLARELDPQIEEHLKAAGSPNKCIENDEACRNLIEERYRRLAMGVYKSNEYADQDFAFAYLKYARVYALFADYMKKQPVAKGAEFSSMSLSYLSEVHGKIFETLIATYKPKDLNDPEFRAFVENFRPWSYSRSRADMFQYGTGVMFELGAKCCLYEDSSRTKLSKSVTDAIAETQNERDGFGLSFTQMIEDIRKDYGDRLFRNLGLSSLISDIGRKDSSFFNEYFFIVDRLFRGHLSTSEIDMMLRNTNSARARAELPKMIASYVKVYLVYMVVETNRYMADIYNSNLASDQIFEQAILRSRNLTSRWYTIQGQIDLLDKLMNSYFKDLLVTSKEYNDTFNLLRAINRNIHYISVYPNMIVMNYFLSKMKGSITFDSWWGKISINADTILKAFFDGDIVSPWFHFGKDLEPMDRLMLLYSLEYLLSTESMKAFVAKDSTGSGNDRSKFFELIFSQYLGDGVDELRTGINEILRSTSGNALAPYTKELCDYELNGDKSLSRRVVINFLELDRFTYSGLGNNSANGVLNSFLTTSSRSAASLLDIIDVRRTYVRAMIEVIEGDLLRTGQIAKKGDPHPDLEKPRALIKQLNDIQTRLRQLFISNHKRYFDCSIRLRETERRRANRLYDEEREHLGKIFDMMKPLAEITDSKQLDDKVKAINESYFRAKDSGYTFDRLDGMNYRLSKYDLLMRMKKRIEADIFLQPTEKEKKSYGNLADFLRPRAVSVYIPDGLVRSEMYSQGTSITIPFKGDRDQFIRDGMAALNGKSDAFIQWQGQMENDKAYVDYLRSLESFYVMSKAEGDDAGPELSAEDLTNAYLSVMASYTLDAYDMQNAKDFQSYGHYPKDFYQGLFFEKDGTTRLPLFYSLMTEVVGSANLVLDQAVSMFGGRGTPGPLFEALDFAKKFNSMQAFVFQPSPIVHDAVLKLYGDRAHQRMNKVSELFAYLKKREETAADAAALDPRLAQPVYLDGQTYYQWYVPGVKNLVDVQRYRDHQILIKNFIQRTGNFYSTKEKVTVP